MTTDTANSVKDTKSNTIPPTNGGEAATEQPFNTPQSGSNVAPGNAGYQLDLLKANHTWGTEHASVIDIFSTKTRLPLGQTIVAPTHVLGQTQDCLRLIPYDDQRGVFQDELAELIPPGAIGISMKHHSHSPEESERVKLQVTHIQIAVGILKDGKRGVCTINNPQRYQEGLFGNASYPMIFIRPKLPPGLTAEETSAYINNMRTWAVIANTFTMFPDNYDGGDPLGTRSVTQMQNFGKRILGALCGNDLDREWLRKPENRIYCAELAHVSMNLGLYFPLNRKQLGSEHFEAVKEQLRTRSFLAANSNPWIQFVELTTAPDVLEPINDRLGTTVSEPNDNDPFGDGLAIEPFTIADILEAFIERTFPRRTLGEQLAGVQSIALKQSWPLILQTLGMQSVPSSSLARQELERLFNQIVNVVGTEHSSYEEFRTQLRPFLEAAKQQTRPNATNGTGAFIPPHCFLVRATDSIQGRAGSSLINWEYVGHGIHRSLLNPVGRQ